ncbi:4392_t:CDS:2 [Gigaspora rosea]|nr:4392_t:CDS:2 [Gigaspora rosea]
MDIAITQGVASQGLCAIYIEIIGDIQESNNKIIKIEDGANHCQHVNYILVEKVTNSNNCVKDHKDENKGLVSFKSNKEIKQQFEELVGNFDRYSEELKFVSKFQPKINLHWNIILSKKTKQNGQISRKIPLIAQLTEEFNEQLLNDKMDIIRLLQTTKSLDSL